MSIFDKWNEQIDGVKLAEEVRGVAANRGDYREVPVGDYDVKVEKMELRESKSGAPMLSIQFRILEGEFKNSCLFMNQVVTQPFQIHLANEFMKSLDSGVAVDFDGNFERYNNMILDVHEAIDKDKLEYVLSYTERKGYPNYRIKEVFAA